MTPVDTNDDKPRKRKRRAGDGDGDGDTPGREIDGTLTYVPGDLARMLRGNALRIFVELQSRGALARYIRVGPSELARTLKIHRNTVTRALARLGELKLIMRGQTGRESWYRVTLPPGTRIGNGSNGK